MTKDPAMTIGARLRPALRGILWLLAIQLPLGLLLAGPVRAATFNVNTTDDPAPTATMCGTNPTCSLRAAIRAANSTASTADIINLPAGTYILLRTGYNENAASTGDLDITSTITINGAGSATTIIDGNTAADGFAADAAHSPPDRVFHIHSSGDLTLNDVTIRNGRVNGAVGGGVYNEGGTATFDQVVITNNTSSNTSSSTTGGNGGGVYNSGTMELGSCTVSNNTADTIVSAGGGGGVYNAGVLTITNCTLSGNQALNSTGTGGATPGGGALQNEGVTGIGSSTNQTAITGSTFSNNSAPLGGAIRNLFGRVILDTSVVDANTAELEGGGVENGGDATFTISSSAIRNNIAQQNGGGVNNLGIMDIGNSAIYGNDTPGSGAAGGAGGGVFNGGNAVLTVFNTTISDNSARLGGGLYNHREAGITNATIYDNSASSTTVPDPGSQVFACGNKDETLGTDCSTGINDSSGDQVIHTQFVNTIIGNSSGLASCGGDVPDLFTSNGHNLETGNTCGFSASGDKRNVPTAGLFNSGLAANGGKIIELLTYSLPTTSPAHDTGDISQCPLTDERNFNRNDEGDGKCDIGAYEISSHNNFNVLDLALDIQYQNATPQNNLVQTTITFTVLNKSSQNASNITLDIKIPTLSWLSIASLRAESASGSCTKTTDGVRCTLPSLARFQTTHFFVATTASQAGAFAVDGDVSSSAADGFRPDNLKSVTVTIPTISNSGVNNFGGTGGGGALGGPALGVLLIPLLLRRRRTALSTRC